MEEEGRIFGMKEGKMETVERFFFSLSTQHSKILTKSTNRDGEEMQFGEGAESNPWFVFDSPWLSMSWTEGVICLPPVRSLLL